MFEKVNMHHLRQGSHRCFRVEGHSDLSASSKVVRSMEHKRARSLLKEFFFIQPPYFSFNIFKVRIDVRHVKGEALYGGST